MTDILFELIRIALGYNSFLSHAPTIEGWMAIYREAMKQSVLGVAFEGVQKLPKEQYPPQVLLCQWIGDCERIKAQNQITNKRTVELYQHFAEAGFRSRILKGQGNAMMYPNPYSRMPGDIDIWIDGSREDIHQFVKSKYPEVRDGVQHIEYPIFKDVIVEVHYRPSTHRITKYNTRLQSFFKERASEQFENRATLPDTDGEICVPTPAFNAVFQMSHLMAHFFVEGIGLRQFIDYYFVLKALNGSMKEDEAKRQFEHLGMLKFARGVMWIETECLGIDEQLLLVEPDERIGKVIMTEMMEGGNFGHHDERYKARNKGYLARGITDTYRLLKLARIFPEDALWKVWRKIENQKWKIKG